MVDPTRECRQALTWFPIAGVALGLLACGGGGGASGTPLTDAFGNSCTALNAEPAVTLDADVQVLASDTGLSYAGSRSLMSEVVSSGGEVYWYDRSGSVFVAREDERVLELRHVEAAAQNSESPFGLAANSTHVYVGYERGAYSDTGIESSGTGHLLSISKQDGQVTDLLPDEPGWFAPITADAERLIVFAASDDRIGFYQVPLDHPRLEALPLGTASLSLHGSEPYDRDAVWALLDLFEQGQLAGDQVYWNSITAPPLGLLRSSFDAAEPELLSARVPSDLPFAAGPGYIVTTHGVRDSGYFSIGFDFVRTDDSGCRSVQGPRGEFLTDVALDAKYAYWSGYLTSGPNAAIRDNTLNRVDLETGAVARLNLPGVTLPKYLRFVAQDDTHLFLSSNGALLSVRKP